MTFVRRTLGLGLAHGSLLLGCTTLAIGCSSGNAAPSSDASVAEGAASGDAAADASGPSCPASAPKDGEACGPQGLVCEYGTAAVPSCDTVASCNGGRFQVVGPSADPSVCPTGLASACPSTFAAVPVGQHCDAYPLACDYAQGRCACTTRSGPTVVDASAQATWICPSPDTSVCPLPRPRLGTSCASKAECDYGTCAIPGATAEICSGGIWTEAATACP